MIEFAPRFFVLPLIALAILLSLPRPAAQTCGPAAAAGSASHASCDTQGRIVMAPARALVR
jgi:hypothetical protein